MVEWRGRARARRDAVIERRARRTEVTDPQIVMDAAAAFLAVRPRSVAETRRRLCTHGYAETLVDQVVARLVALGYLDDAAFARAWVESRDRSRPRGGLALRQELARKGVERDVVETVMADRADASEGAALAAGERPLAAGPRGVEDQAAERLLARKAASLSREPDVRRRRQKAYALLARHGFPPDICRRVAATVVEDGADAFDAFDGDPDENENGGS
jgi:regulatory protein